MPNSRCSICRPYCRCLCCSPIHHSYRCYCCYCYCCVDDVVVNHHHYCYCSSTLSDVSLKSAFRRHYCRRRHRSISTIGTETLFESIPREAKKPLTGKLKMLIHTTAAALTLSSPIFDSIAARRFDSFASVVCKKKKRQIIKQNDDSIRRCVWVTNENGCSSNASRRFCCSLTSFFGARN